MIILCAYLKTTLSVLEMLIKKDSRFNEKELRYLRTPQEVISVLKDKKDTPCFVVSDTAIPSSYNASSLTGALEISGYLHSLDTNMNTLVFFGTDLRVISKEPYLAINSMSVNANEKLFNALEEFIFFTDK